MKTITFTNDETGEKYEMDNDIKIFNAHDIRLVNPNCVILKPLSKEEKQTYKINFFRGNGRDLYIEDFELTPSQAQALAKAIKGLLKYILDPAHLEAHDLLDMLDEAIILIQEDKS